MNPMKSISAHSLIVCLIISIGYLPPVHAVTDAELEALEKQLEQQEAEEKKQVERERNEKAAAEAKRKADQKREIEAEQNRKEQEEVNHFAEAEAKKKAEEARFAEIERQRLEDENKKKAEEEKRAYFFQYIRHAESAMDNKDYKGALKNYTQALEILPSDSEALAGQSRAKKLLDACAVLVGEWDWSFDIFVTINADGSMSSRALIPNHGTWECTDPLQGKFTLRWVVGGWVERIAMSDDGNTLNIRNNIDFRYQAWRKGTKKFDPSREIKL